MHGVSACWGEVVQRRLAQRVGEFRVVHGAGQDQRTDRGGDGDERQLMRAGLSPLGQIRATRSIISLIRRVAARRTRGAWRGISEPSAATAQPVSTLSTCAFER